MTFLLLALLGGVLVVWLYRDREIPVSGRWLLAAARVLTLTVILLLLWNPSIPGAPDGTAGDRPWLLVDGSLSMSVSAGGVTPWERARERGGEGDWGGVLIFGEGVRPVTAEELSVREPDALGSRLTPGLERAAESGARGVVVLSDLRLEDAGRIRDEARTLGLSMDVEGLANRVVNAGIAGLDLPATADSGSAVAGSVAFFAQGLGSDSLEVEVREEGRLVASRRVGAPREGRLGRVELSLPPPGGTGARRYVASVSASGDAFPDDDRRPAWVSVSPQEGGVVLVSLRPGWEPRFLVPVLERAGGLPGEAFLAVGQGRFMATGEGAEGPRVVDAAEVRRRVAGAAILVVHGLGAGAPGWLVERVEAARRVVVFARDRVGAGAVGVRVGGALSGEWYPAAPLPPSPLAAELAGADLSRLPPLEDLLPLTEGSDPGAVPLHLQREGRGPREAALVLAETDAGRRVVVLGRGLWRWAFREGPERATYRRLWAGAAGWLLARGSRSTAPEVRPRERVIPRGRPIPWESPGPGGDSVRLRVSGPGDSVVTDTVVAFEEGRARTSALPPGEYAYRATPPGDPDRIVGRGRFDVESFTGELLTSPARLEDEPTAEAGDLRSETGRPLRTHPLPYLLALGLLCAEWIGRRKRGLR